VAARIQVTACQFITFIPSLFVWLIISGHQTSSRIVHHFVRHSLVVASPASASRRLAHHCWFQFSLHLFPLELLAAGSAVNLQLVAPAHSFAARRHLIACDRISIAGAFPSCLSFVIAVHLSVLHHH
jgi:hypothetical protein